MILNNTILFRGQTEQKYADIYIDKDEFVRYL